MKTNRKMFLSLCIVLLLCIPSGCGKKQNDAVNLEEVIVGRWISSSRSDYYVIFNENGTGFDDGELFSYYFTDSRINMAYDDDEYWTAFDVSILDKNHLVFVEEDGFRTDLFRSDAQGRRIIGE